MSQLTEKDFFHVRMHAKLSNWVIWLVVVVAHLSLAVVLEAAFWWFRISPKDVESFSQSTLQMSAVQLLVGLLGGWSAILLFAARWIKNVLTSLLRKQIFDLEQI